MKDLSGGMCRVVWVIKSVDPKFSMREMCKVIFFSVRYSKPFVFGRRGFHK